MGRVSSRSWDPSTALTADGAYLGVQTALLDGDKQEAIRLLDRIVWKHEIYLRWFYPDRYLLMFDYWLDPLRKDPLRALDLLQANDVAIYLIHDDNDTIKTISARGANREELLFTP